MNTIFCILICVCLPKLNFSFSSFVFFFIYFLAAISQSIKFLFFNFRLFISFTSSSSQTIGIDRIDPTQWEVCANQGAFDRFCVFEKKLRRRIDEALICRVTASIFYFICPALLFQKHTVCVCVVVIIIIIISLGAGGKDVQRFKK